MTDDSFKEKDSSILPKKTMRVLGHGTANVRAPRQVNLTNSLDEIFAFARKENASDVHLSSQNPLIFRKFGRLIPVTTEIFTSQHINALLTESLPLEIVRSFKKTGDVEYVHTITGYGRFRIILTKQRNGLELIARLIPIEIPNFAASGMPTSCISLIKWSQGIVLITGPAGCGKTTTLATLVEMINQRRHEHIIILEDPIEIIYEPILCQISQRQIGTHTLSQTIAMRAALREDPDVIVIGEIKNLETLRTAIIAAETGHLVLGTLNTVNSVQTISRLIDSFPADEQQTIATMLSDSLRGIICQQLIPKKDGTGMVAAYEVLLNNPSVTNHIRKGTIVQIENTIVTSKSSGMVLMNHSLDTLLKNGIISEDEYYSRLKQDSYY